MKNKHVYRAETLGLAADALAIARQAGIDDADIALVARPDIEMQVLPDDYRDGRTDFGPALVKGAVGGGTVGLVAGLIATAIPTLGVTLVGAAAIAAVGAATGTWSAGLIGASLPDPVRRRFDDEIAQGRILVVIDAEPDTQATLDATLREAGLVQLPFDEVSALS